MSTSFHFQVLHSQRMNDTALHPWVIAEKDGKLLAGHCNYMAELGESCTHVAATEKTTFPGLYQSCW